MRLVPLGRYVTPDEPAWVYRSIRFADALAARDWSAVPSTGHPGVTTMWLGAVGVTIQKWLNPAESAAHLDWIRRLAWLTPENGEALRHLALFLPWGRTAIALVTTLGLVALYPLLTRLLDHRIALLTMGLLALDPFLIGHSGLLHTDALLTTFSLLALIAALNGLREPRRSLWWALSGLFTGLALLTKTPALILFPFILLLIVVAHLRKSQTRHLSFFICHCSLFIRHLSLFIRHLSLFLASSLITFFALYPALWASPVATLGNLFSFAGRHVETAQRPVFFAGHMTYDPGPAFYLAVFLVRISPVVLVGLVVGLVTLRRLPPDRRLAFLLLLTFALGFGALMSLGAKKHDRYLLPALPPLTLAAALGIGTQLNRYNGKSGRSATHQRTKIYQSAILVFQALIALAFAPYPLTYTNPLVGGPWVASRMISLDWGERAGAAARQLNRLPNADQLTVAVPSIPSFAPLFEGRTIPLEQFTLADYLVRSAAQSPSHPIAQSPSHPVTHLSYLSHAAIYTNTAPFQQTAYLDAHAGPDDAILLDADLPLRRHYDGPGTLVAVTDLPDRASVADRLLALSTEHPNLWLVADPAAAPITTAQVRQVLESIATPVSATTVASATITRYASLEPQTPAPTPTSKIAVFGDQLTLVDALLPNAPVNTAFPVFLRWQVPTSTPTDLHASLYLRDPAGHLWNEVGQLVLDATAFPTSAWIPGQWADNALKLRPPQHIPPGDYTVQLTVTDGEGAQMGAWNDAGQFLGVRVPLGNVEIAPPAHPAGPAPCSKGHPLTADPFLACAPELTRWSIPSGDRFTLALTWSALEPPQTDYNIRWRLLDSIAAVADEETVALSPYPTAHWRDGDTFEVRYDLRADPTLPAGVYTLTLNVLAPTDQPLWSEDEPVASIEVLPRQRLFDLPTDISHPLDLTLGGMIHLRGVDLPAEEISAHPGDSLPLTLYWQADGPTDIDYTVFVHLVGPDGRPHGQVDHIPAAGAAPTTSWVADQVIADHVSLPVAGDAPAGLYHVAIGMYDVISGGRLPIVDASGQPLPDNQAILPVEITIIRGAQ